MIGETTQAAPQADLRVIQVEGEHDLYPCQQRKSQQARFCSFNSRMGKLLIPFQISDPNLYYVSSDVRKAKHPKC